jgi:VWFA-related protein
MPVVLILCAVGGAQPLDRARGVPEVVEGQQPPPAPVFRSRVDAIEIEMRAVDRDGNPVVDLEAADVEVLEDGRRQEITAFSRVSVPIVRVPDSSPLPALFPPLDVVSNRVAGSRRIFVLILDDLHVDRRNTPYVKQAARRFVEAYVQPGDLVSVVYTGVRPDAAQDFTTDRRLLLAAIDKFIGRKLPPATVERMEQYNALFRARGRPQFEDLRDRQDGERAFNARAAMATIEALSAVLGRVTGRRKAAIVFSEGVDYDLSGLRSRGRISSTGSGPTVLGPTVPTGASEIDAIGRPDVHSYAHDVLLSLQSAIGAASRANVALYPMDVHGGDTSDAVGDLGAAVDDPTLGLSAQNVHQEMRDAQETLAVLAENTGGFAAFTPSNYDAAFSRIVRESSDYYLLAYSPWNPAPDGTYRAITVKVNRPGVRVSARGGYYAPRKPVKRGYRFEAPGISDGTSTLVMAPMQAAGLSLDVQTIALRRDKKSADVIVTAHVDGPELAGPPGSPDVLNALELALMAVDSAGKVHAATGRVIEVRLSSEATGILRTSGYRIVSRIQVPAGRYQIRQAVRERNGGRHGSVFADLEVPTFGDRFSMGGVLLTSIHADAIPTSVDPDTYRRLAVLPSVRRVFSPDDEIIAATEIYQPPPGQDVEVIATISDASGTERYHRATKVTAREFKTAGGTYRHAVQIPLRDIREDVMLTLEARPIGAPRHALARRVSFAVAPH